MSHHAALSEFIHGHAAERAIPGVALGVWVDGHEHYVCHGVTSIDNPLPVDPDTLFLLGSVTKTYTATALMRLAVEGRVDLEARVREYVNELVLDDANAASRMSVLNLLNHTSGLDWALIFDSGEGDDALARYVDRLAELPLIAAPGERASYSQAGFNLAGRIVEKVTGLTFERALAELIFEPLGLAHSFFARDDIMTRRFVVGHNRGQDGALSIARLWRRARGDNPGGGLASSAADQLRWARFHLGDGRSESGIRVLPTQALHRMQQRSVALRGSNLGDAIGISWFLRDIDGVRTLGHGGSANGQFADLLLVPDRDFAVVALSNAGPDGIPFNHAVLRWVLEAFLGIRDRDPEPLPYDPARARELVGSYTNDAMTFEVISGPEGLIFDVKLKPELRAKSDKALPPDPAPMPLGLLPGDGDEYIITGGAFVGQRGFFTRNASGTIVGVDLAGRIASRRGSPVA